MTPLKIFLPIIALNLDFNPLFGEKTEKRFFHFFFFDSSRKGYGRVCKEVSCINREVKSFKGPKAGFKKPVFRAFFMCFLHGNKV
jgi:hypothetical protein